MTRLRIMAVLALAACSAAAQQDNDTLADSIRSYNDGVRWGRYEIAATSVPPRERAQFVDEMDERGEDVKITDYEIMNVLARGTRVAKVRIKIAWYRSSKNTVHETHALQTWERKGKLWFMVHESRLRGPEMPGLPEPASPVAGEASDSPREH